MKNALRNKVFSASLIDKGNYRQAIKDRSPDYDELNHAMLESHYPLIRAWVLHNEAHRQMTSNPSENIQIPLAEFADQWQRL